MTGTAYGLLDFTVEDFIDGQPTGRSNFYDIVLYEGKEIYSTLAQNTLSSDGITIYADEIFSVSDNATVAIKANAINGIASGDGVFVKGDHVALVTSAFDGYVFIGWFNEDNERVSTNTIYEFSARQDIVLTARFVEYRESETNDEGAFDVIIPSTTSPDSFFINLTSETINMSQNFTVSAYSVNGGRSWKRGALPTGDRLNRLFNRELTLWLAPSLDGKTPAGEFIKFPTITARPRANLERLAPRYGAETWNLTKRRTDTPAERDYEWAKSANGRTPDAGATWMLSENGKCNIAIEPPRVRTRYIFRTPATGDGSVANPYIPASRMFRVRPRPFAKAPNYSIRNDSIRLRNGDWYIIENGEPVHSDGTPLDVKDVPKDTIITIWRGQTGVRPPSARQDIRR
jgi:uncharacterized repeat protein (TIGR02543 family)